MKKLLYIFLLSITLLLAPSCHADEPKEGEKVYLDSQGKGLIKGNMNDKGEYIYHMPGQRYYKVTIPEKMFKSEEQAKRAGFRRSMK